MKNSTKRLKYFLLVSAVLVIIARIALSMFEASTKVDERVYLPVVYPDAISFSEKKLTPAVYEALDSYGDVIGYSYNTYDIAPEVRGYAGPIEVLVGMKRSGEITGVAVIAHNETKIYMQKLTDERFYDRFSYKKVLDKFVLDDDIDGVTHATVSAQAIARAVKRSSVTVANSHLNMNIPPEVEAGISSKELADASILLLLTIGSVVLFLTKRENTFSTMKSSGKIITGYRDIMLLAVLGYVGFYKSSPVSIANVINVFYLRLPDFKSVFFYVLIGGFFVTALLFGRLYCGYLCPFSALIEFVEKIKVKRIRSYDRDLPAIRYVFLWAILLLVLLFDKIEISSFEPYLALFSTNQNVFMWSALGLTVVFTMFHRRIWCRYFCAVGAFLSIITKIAPYKNRPPESCDACGACSKVCPVEIDFTDIDNFAYTECIACGKCHEYCTKSTNPD